MWEMKAAFALVTFFLTGIVHGDPSVRVQDVDTIEVSWPSVCGKQYGLFFSPDLKTWSWIGGRHEGIDGSLSSTHEREGREQGFYRIEEFRNYVLDPARFEFGTEGNKWTYDVSRDSLLGVEFFVWETEIVGRRQFRGQDVIEWSFLRDGVWDQSIYLLDDFTNGIYEAGGDHATQGEQSNSPPLPSILQSFTPGVSASVRTTSTGFGEQNEEITITIEKDPLTVGAGTFTGLFKVVHEFTGTSQGFPVSGVTTEWFAFDVGLVKHVGDLTLLGSVFNTTFELSSYEVN